ncbi:MAG: hypothetical protein V7700_01940 [Halioglobus sp.]
MSHSSHKLLFTVAAGFNWLVGLILFFNADLLLELLHITPVPIETTFLRLFAGLVFVFGFGYYAAGSDLKTNAPVIRLGGIAKLMVVAIAAYEVVLGNISWQLMLVASADLIFALLFFRALRIAITNQNITT